jgi:hypothetical protein
MSPGELIGEIKYLLANPDLGNTKPPTFVGSCKEIPNFTRTTSPGLIVYSPSE